MKCNTMLTLRLVRKTHSVHLNTPTSLFAVQDFSSRQRHERYLTPWKIPALQGNYLFGCTRIQFSQQRNPKRLRDAHCERHKNRLARSSFLPLTTCKSATLTKRNLSGTWVYEISPEIASWRSPMKRALTTLRRSQNVMITLCVAFASLGATHPQFMQSDECRLAATIPATTALRLERTGAGYDGLGDGLNQDTGRSDNKNGRHE